MGGEGPPIWHGDDRPDQDRLRAVADHWRGVAEQRATELDAIRRRPAVRLAIRVERPVLAVWRRLRPRIRSTRAWMDRVGVFARSVARTRRSGNQAEREAAAATGPSAIDHLTAARLLGAIDGDVAAAVPTVVYADRGGWWRKEHGPLVRAAGVSFEMHRGAPVAVARSAGSPLGTTGPVAEVDAGLLPGLVVAQEAAAAHRLGEGATDLDALDLCLRLRAHGGRIVHVPDAVVVDARRVTSRRRLRRPIDERSPGWRSLVEEHGSAMARLARRRDGVVPARWAITTAVPSARAAPRWGDWHFAQALASALRRLDQEVVVQTHDAADSLVGRSCDVHLVLRGLAPVRRTRGQHHVVWVISHPELFTTAEADSADLVLVASAPYADELRRQTDTPVEVLLQATDPSRFRPGPPHPAHRHDVTVVAKTRGVMRASVRDAVAAGLSPAVYGGGWEGLVEPGVVVADHVDNGDLPDVYRSAGVVLNDHWDTMREWGFVSNRIFDVLACGTPVISDAVAGIGDLFDGAVPVYSDPAELGRLVAADLAAPETGRARADRGRHAVLAKHTFGHRAAELVDLLPRHGLQLEGP